MLTIYGGPTTGKTTFLKIAREEGLVALDTDDLSQEINDAMRASGTLGENVDWVSVDGSEEEKQEFYRILTDSFGPWLEDGDPDVLVTSYWHVICRNKLKADYAFYRPDANLIYQLSVERGGRPIPAELAEKWNHDLLKNGEAEACLGTKLVPLAKGQYISDYVMDEIMISEEEDSDDIH